ncbi:transglycosylase family protein [Mycobacterium sp. E740]|uniref:transglycosylase family protein n=1 Tax=Mycobacterium sp. E740 TaxID=1834149 RepID=UPI0007FE5D13|nr:transglycosylase family protein [Mycobacterium sp. E740]OBI74121.1 transglycosylase [Mycobacterium sp. E740]
MNVRKAVRKGLLATAISGALGIVPIAVAGSANADSVNWDAIAQCESGGNWSTNTGNGHFGGLQFKQATWASNGGVGNPATASRAEQIRVAENVLRTQGLKAWPKCGPRGATPAVWTTPSAPTARTAPAAGSGCAAMPSSGLFGFVNPRQMCAALLAPVGALTGAS